MGLRDGLLFCPPTPMALDVQMFEAISPYRFISFTIPNTSRSNSSSLLRVAVLDSPVRPTDSPRFAVLYVPQGLESDWIFSTESGHFQLLFSCPDGISRLILIGSERSSDDLPPMYRRPMEDDFLSYLEELKLASADLLPALCPKSLSRSGIADVSVVEYESNVISSVLLEKGVGGFVGEMLVEDVEIESESEIEVCGIRKREFRRRLRFKRMPNLIQTEIRIVPKISSGSVIEVIGEIEFDLDLGDLVHSYLAPMVASLSLISDHVEQLLKSGLKPKALCLGVGGGALLAFLRNRLGFQVMGVDADGEVLRISKKYFGLEVGEFLHVCTGDALKIFKRLAYQANGHDLGSLGTSEPEYNRFFSDVEQGYNGKFEVVMVDLDSGDAMSGVTAPPLEFLEKHNLLAVKGILSNLGIVVINFIPPSESFFEILICDLKEVFQDLYKIDVGNGENFVLIASVSSILDSTKNHGNSFLRRMRTVISEAYIDSIQKI